MKRHQQRLPYPQYQNSGISWLGSLPDHWQVRRMKNVLARNDSGVWGEDADTGGTIVLRSTEQSVDGKWQIREPAQRRLSDAEYQSGRLVAGDLVITKSSGSALHLGKTTLVTPEVEALDCCFSNFMQRLRASQGHEPRFLYYILNSPIGREQLNFYGTTTTGLANLNGGVIGRIELPSPPLPEQRAIADFLDRETARIDALIAKKQRLIELLQEKRTALISHAVTRGLDAGVAMKESGVPWLGQVPAHWKVVRSKQLFWPRKELARPDDVQLSATQAYGVIPQAEFEEKVGRRVVQVLLHLDRRKHVEEGDFVISMRSFQGGLERAWVSGCIRSSYVVLKPTDGVDIGFFSYLLKSDRYIKALQKTANFIRDGQDVNFDNFCQVDLPSVPLNEQRAIADFLDCETARIDGLVAKMQEAIDRLRECRTALISAAVTGKIDVREEVGT